MRVKCLAQQHNKMSVARTRTRMEDFDPTSCLSYMVGLVFLHGYSTVMIFLSTLMRTYFRMAFLSGIDVCLDINFAA